MTKISASFEVTNWDEQPFDERKDAAKLTTAKVTKSYSGDIEGESVTEWQMAYTDDGSAAFVGLERIDGTVAGHSGTLVLQHLGTYQDGSATATLSVVDGCGSADLAGVSGTGDFKADPAGQVDLELSFAKGAKAK
jgi:hypothetical protein